MDKINIEEIKINSELKRYLIQELNNFTSTKIYNKLSNILMDMHKGEVTEGGGGIDIYHLYYYYLKELKEHLENTHNKIFLDLVSNVYNIVGEVKKEIEVMMQSKEKIRKLSLKSDVKNLLKKLQDGAFDTIEKEK